MGIFDRKKPDLEKKPVMKPEFFARKTQASDERDLSWRRQQEILMAELKNESTADGLYEIARRECVKIFGNDDAWNAKLKTFIAQHYAIKAQESEVKTFCLKLSQAAFYISHDQDATKKQLDEAAFSMFQASVSFDNCLGGSITACDTLILSVQTNLYEVVRNQLTQQMISAVMVGNQAHVPALAGYLMSGDRGEDPNWHYPSGLMTQDDLGRFYDLAQNKRTDLFAEYLTDEYMKIYRQAAEQSGNIARDEGKSEEDYQDKKRDEFSTRVFNSFQNNGDQYLMKMAGVNHLKVYEAKLDEKQDAAKTLIYQALQDTKEQVLSDEEVAGRVLAAKNNAVIIDIINQTNQYSARNQVLPYWLIKKGQKAFKLDVGFDLDKISAFVLTMRTKSKELSVQIGSDISVPEAIPISYGENFQNLDKAISVGAPLSLIRDMVGLKQFQKPQNVVFLNGLLFHPQQKEILNFLKKKGIKADYDSAISRAINHGDVGFLKNNKKEFHAIIKSWLSLDNSKGAFVPSLLLQNLKVIKEALGSDKSATKIIYQLLNGKIHQGKSILNNISNAMGLREAFEAIEENFGKKVLWNAAVKNKAVIDQIIKSPALFAKYSDDMLAFLAKPKTPIEPKTAFYIASGILKHQGAACAAKYYQAIADHKMYDKDARNAAKILKANLCEEAVEQIVIGKNTSEKALTIVRQELRNLADSKFAAAQYLVAKDVLAQPDLDPEEAEYFLAQAVASKHPEAQIFDAKRRCQSQDVKFKKEGFALMEELVQSGNSKAYDFIAASTDLYAAKTQANLADFFQNDVMDCDKAKILYNKALENRKGLSAADLQELNAEIEVAQAFGKGFSEEVRPLSLGAKEEPKERVPAKDCKPLSAESLAGRSAIEVHPNARWTKKIAGTQGVVVSTI